MDTVTISRDALRELAKWAYAYAEYETTGGHEWLAQRVGQAGDMVREIAQLDHERQLRIQELVETADDYDFAKL